MADVVPITDAVSQLLSSGLLTELIKSLISRSGMFDALGDSFAGALSRAIRVSGLGQWAGAEDPRITELHVSQMSQRQFGMLATQHMTMPIGSSGVLANQALIAANIENLYKETQRSANRAISTLSKGDVAAVLNILHSRGEITTEQARGDGDTETFKRKFNAAIEMQSVGNIMGWSAKQTAEYGTLIGGTRNSERNAEEVKKYFANALQASESIEEFYDRINNKMPKMITSMMSLGISAPIAANIASEAAAMSGQQRKRMYEQGMGEFYSTTLEGYIAEAGAMRLETGGGQAIQAALHARERARSLGNDAAVKELTRIIEAASKSPERASSIIEASMGGGGETSRLLRSSFRTVLRDPETAMQVIGRSKEAKSDLNAYLRSGLRTDLYDQLRATAWEDPDQAAELNAIAAKVYSGQALSEQEKDTIRDNFGTDALLSYESSIKFNNLNPEEQQKYIDQLTTIKNSVYASMDLSESSRNKLEEAKLNGKNIVEDISESELKQFAEENNLPYEDVVNRLKEGKMDLYSIKGGRSLSLYYDKESESFKKIEGTEELKEQQRLLSEERLEKGEATPEDMVTLIINAIESVVDAIKTAFGGDKNKNGNDETVKDSGSNAQG